MTKTEFLKHLQSLVNTSERAMLRDEKSKLVIGKHNRATMMKMLRSRDVGDDSIDEEKVVELTKALKAYLNQNMEEAGHKWVILASLFNTFVMELPMHPIQVVGVKVAMEDGQKVYYCPARDESEGSVCLFCVCRMGKEERYQ